MKTSTLLALFVLTSVCIGPSAWAHTTPAIGIADRPPETQLGIGLGGAYVWSGGGTSAVAVQARWDRPWLGDTLRLSPLVFYSSDRFTHATGAMVGAEYLHWWTGSISTGIGVIAGLASFAAVRPGGLKGPGGLAGLTATPLAVRLGSARQFEAAIQTFVVGVNGYGRYLPGGFVSLSVFID